METTNLTLVKGERLDLTKGNPSLKIANVGLGWDVNQGNSGAFDLDAFAIVKHDGRAVEKSDIIYFNNKTGHGLQHMGDNLTGAGDGDDETIKVDLPSIDAAVSEILIGVNIYDAVSRRQNFGMVNNAFIRVYDGETNQELLKFDLTEDYSAFTGMIMGKLYRKDGEWRFNAIGEGKNGDVFQIAGV